MPKANAMDKPAITDSSQWRRLHVLLSALFMLIFMLALAWQLRALP